jgi:hypothetical protein
MPRGDALSAVALRVDAWPANITRICLAWSCASPKKAKENSQLLADKQMWSGHNSVFASLDHSDAWTLITYLNSDPGFIKLMESATPSLSL